MAVQDQSHRTAEHARLAEATGPAEDDLFSANPWYEWGPYLSERAWGTVREDYSESGDAWDALPARSRPFSRLPVERGRDGGDLRHPHELCLALALWNGNDPILKERMFGLTGPQGNHGEDAKEYWWYLDGLPSHALLHWRYHYPQAAFPYDQLVHHGRGLARSGIRTARHRSVRRGPLLVGGRHLREGVTHGHPDAHRRREPRPRTRRDRGAADAVVPQHLVVGRRRRPPAAQRRRRHAERRPTIDWPATGSTPSAAPTAPFRGAVLRQRDERGRGCTECSPTSPYPRTASTTTSCPVRRR